MKSFATSGWIRTILSGLATLLRHNSTSRQHPWRTLLLTGITLGKVASLRLSIDSRARARTREDFLETAIQAASRTGLWLEFGVAGGQSINLIANRVESVTIHGFDSFYGLPEDWNRSLRKGAFSRHGMLPFVRSNVSLHPGLFADSLPAFLQRTAEFVSFVHIDSDLYSSAIFVLGQIHERVRHGTVLAFDEFITPSPSKNEAHAFREFLRRTGFGYEVVVSYLGEMGDIKVGVRLLRPPSSAGCGPDQPRIPRD
jgi:hypothetical protein